MGRHDSAASAASEPAPKEKKARVYTPGTAATRMRNLISRSTAKINDLCRQGTALAEQGTAVEDYIQRMKVCKEMNDRLLREKCNKESLPADPEALASAINEVAVELRAHTGVMNSFKSLLVPGLLVAKTLVPESLLVDFDQPAMASVKENSMGLKQYLAIQT